MVEGESLMALFAQDVAADLSEKIGEEACPTDFTFLSIEDDTVLLHYVKNNKELIHVKLIRAERGRWVIHLVDRETDNDGSSSAI